MTRISSREYSERMEVLRSKVTAEGLDAFVVSSFLSIYYLTGKGFEPFERPFFLLVLPDSSPKLLVPKLEERHMAEAHNIRAQDIVTYWDYPARKGRGWPEALQALIGNRKDIGVEPGLSLECAVELSGFAVRTLPLIEQLRSVKSKAEIEMIRRAAKYADFGVECLLSSSYYGSTTAEGFAQTRAVTSRIIREVDEWEPLTTKVVMAPWIAEGSQDQLAENMVISIEPGIYIEQLGGFRHSDTILVTKDGSELLTRQPADLKTLTIRGWKLMARLRGWMIRRMFGLGENVPSPGEPEAL